MKNKKIFVLDTNVILHDSLSILNFAENDIVIPITVLEELDKFKKGNDLINLQARKFMRKLDKIAGDELFKKGVSLGHGKGVLFVETGQNRQDEILKIFNEDKPDHRILAVAYYYTKNVPQRETILVTKDINLRMKAKSVGVIAEDYQTGKVKNVEILHKSANKITLTDDKIISKLYHSEEGIPLDKFGIDRKFIPNEYFVLKGNNSSVLAYYSKIDKTIRRVIKESAYGITPRNAEQTFALDALTRNEVKLISITGKAGSGKTLLALAAALKQRKNYQQILLARPLVALSNKEMGFLPGNEKDKISPYMQPLFDNLSVIKHQFSASSKSAIRIENMLQEEKLMITPLAYIRGRSLSNVYFIVDEAQNLTPHEIKTIITRAGEGTKMIFTGDIQQIDSPYLDTQSNGLSYLSDKMRGQDIFAHINLVSGERSHLADLASNLL